MSHVVRAPAAKKAMIIGLDCAEPSLIESWRSELPTLSALWIGESTAGSPR